MADKDSLEIEVEDDSVVTLEDASVVSTGDITEPEDNSVVEVKDPKKPRVRQTKNELVEITEASKKAVQDAQEALKSAEAARQAAEQQAASERQRALEYQRLSQQREEEVKSTYESQIQDREFALITNGIEAANRELEASRLEQQRAYEAGEFAQATAAGARMAKAAAALDRYETAKVNHENRPKQPIKPDQHPQVRTTSTIDDYLSTVPGVRAQSWLRLHPECVPPEFGGNAQSNAKVMQGHYAAIAKGVTQGSDDYFKTLEEHIGYRTAAISSAAAITPAEEEDEVQPARRTAPRQAIPSAPVSRENNPGGNITTTGSTTSVRLTPAQQEIALISFTPKQGEDDAVYKKRAFSAYAAELVSATREGKIGRLTH